MDQINITPNNEVHSDEQEKIRLQALEDYNIVDTPRDEKFDNIVALASYICGTPISLISLITQNRQWFKAKVGLDISETPRSFSFCQHAILNDDVLEIPDTLEDIRFYSNPLVTGNPNIRFYAGAPLVNTNGYKLGTLCVIDTQPRELSEAQKMALATLSEQVVAHLELRLKKQELEIEKQKLNEVMNFVGSHLPGTIKNLEEVANHLLDENLNVTTIRSNSIPALQENVKQLQQIYSRLNKAS